MTLKDKVTQIISEQLGVDAKNVHGKTSFVGDLGADSLDTVEMVMAFEEEFGIEIADEDFEGLATVTDLIECLKSKHADACRDYE